MNNKFLMLLLCYITIESVDIFAHAKNCTAQNTQSFKHNIQLQLTDAYGFPVENTEFWVTLDIIKKGSIVTVAVPLINFQTGQCADTNPFCPTFPPGGYLTTIDGFLPEDLRPKNVSPISVIAASNNGMSPVFSFAESTTELPIPPAGYIVQITNGGSLQVQQAGTFGNVIETGPQIIMPCSIKYVTQPTYRLCKNSTLSTGASNITEWTYFPGNSPGGDGLRDFHINDAFDGIVAWAWADNSNIDQTNNASNVMVVVGTATQNGRLKFQSPIQLTHNEAGYHIFDTAVCINRLHKNNIVVSYEIVNEFTDPQVYQACRAVSFDGGKTWPINGPLNIVSGQPAANGDCPGVKSDKFGNMWFCTSNMNDDDGNFINQPFFALSSDGGITFNLIYTVPLLPDFIAGLSAYDFPSYCFGGLGDGSDTYGLWFSAEYFSPNGGPDVAPLVGFIPIYGLDAVGTGTTLALDNFINTQNIGCITASIDGRVWVQGIDYFPANGFTFPFVQRYKSPGSIDANYAGPFDIATIFGPWIIQNATTISSGPRGYFPTLQGNIYDDARQALYSIIYWQIPDDSQNMEIYFMISRDNGLTWSKTLVINSTNFANRGFPSMALDPVTGDIVFGWYDGRNDDSYKSVEYMAAIIPAKTLTELVNAIPLSNPTFETEFTN